MSLSIGLEVEFRSINLYDYNPDNVPIFKKRVKLEKEWYENQWEINDILLQNLKYTHPNIVRYKLITAILDKIENVYTKTVYIPNKNINVCRYVITDDRVSSDYPVYSGIHLHIQSSKFKFTFLKRNLIKSFLFNVWLWYEKLWRGIVNERELVSHHLHGFWRNLPFYHYYFAVKPKFRIAAYRRKTDTYEIRNLTLLDFLNQPLYGIIERNKAYDGNYVEFLIQLANGKHLATWNRFINSPFLPLYVAMYMQPYEYLQAFYNGQLILPTSFRVYFRKPLNIFTKAYPELSYKMLGAKKYLIPQYYFESSQGYRKWFNLVVKIAKTNPKETLKLDNIKLQYRTYYESDDSVLPNEYFRFGNLKFGIIDLFLADIYRSSKIVSNFNAFKTDTIAKLQEYIKSGELDSILKLESFIFDDKFNKALIHSLWIPYFVKYSNSLKTKVMNFDMCSSSEIEDITSNINAVLDNLFDDAYDLGWSKDFEKVLRKFFELYNLECKL